MKPLKYIFTFGLLFAAITLSAQNITKQAFYQEGHNIVITYHLDRTANITVEVSTDGGKTFSAPLKQVTGDVGTDVRAGNRRIIWDVRAEREQLVGNNIVFRLKARLSNKNLYFGKHFFQTYLYGGTDFTNRGAGYSVDCIIGWRIKQPAFIGLNLGWHQMFNTVHYTYKGMDLPTQYWFAPVGLNVRFFIPLGRTYQNTMFFDLSGNALIGYGYYFSDTQSYAHLNKDNAIITLNDHWEKMSMGINASGGIGFDIDHISMSLGYTYQLGDIRGHMGYFKFGARLGRD